MSGNDCWNKSVFSHWRKVEIVGDDWTWTGKVFQVLRLQQETSDGQWLSDDMTERTARVQDDDRCVFLKRHVTLHYRILCDCQS